MSKSNLALVILAAGRGTRMKSRLPKVLHPVCGRPILEHTVRLGRELGAKRIVAVVGEGEEQVRAALDGQGVEFARQDRQLGSGHAAAQARELLADHDGPVLAMNGDHPLYTAESFRGLLELYAERRPELAILVAEYPEPTGYGRVVRGADGRVLRIVEEADADAATRAIREVNLGAYLAEGRLLFERLGQLDNDNAQGEYYLTDLIANVNAKGGRVEAASVGDWRETLGINSRVELAAAERLMRARINAHWLREGVTLIDPDTTYIDAGVTIGADTTIWPGCVLRGETRIGSGVRIDANSTLEDMTIGDDCWIKPNCRLEQSVVGERCEIGPSAHFRPNVRLGDDCRIGNFVEVKNSTLGDGTKADHLSYLGDADLGTKVSIGCGSITVNYDSQKKTRTTIGDRAFVGCNSNLIAPVTLEPDAYIAAGSTITNDVPEGALGVARARQRNVEGWRKRRFSSEDGH